MAETQEKLKHKMLKRNTTVFIQMLYKWYTMFTLSMETTKMLTLEVLAPPYTNLNKEFLQKKKSEPKNNVT